QGGRQRARCEERGHDLAIEGMEGSAGGGEADLGDLAGRDMDELLKHAVSSPEGRQTVGDQMTTRRELLGSSAAALAGLVFAGCGLVPSAAAQPAPHRREVVVNGKRIRTIDCHAHCHVPEAMALMNLKETYPALVVSTDRIKLMDEQGIDVEALSINPIFWYKAERDLAAQIVKLQNEKLAETCAQHKDRFVGLGSVALQYPDLAAEQLEDSVKHLGLRGTLIGGSVNGEELSDPRFHPFWAKAEQLGAVVFIHPQGTPELAGRLKGNGVLSNVIGNPLETTIALSHLIFEGTLDQFPGIKILAAHGGGYLPSYAGRSDAGCVTFPARCTKQLKLKPSQYLHRLYYDSMVFTPEGLRHLVAEVGLGQIVMGTDYPFPWTKTAVDHILDTPTLSDGDRAAMLGENAARLLNLSA
ncbi:MAG TPA: amidohydrolase family protein, partial [Stellaceae bacterium]|nr:amidohydrolase family protein [Stellaceae bacterium]